MFNKINPAFLIFLILFFLLHGCIQESSEDFAFNKEVVEYEDTSFLLEKANFYGKTILALYKSSDNQSEEQNLIFYHLSNPLMEMGFTVIYHDVDESIPTEKEMEGVRAVITWFAGASMVDPDTYLDFVNKTIDSGRKYIILDNFGAWQYRLEEEKYIENFKLNYTLSRLGLRYIGDWLIGQPDKLKIADIVPEMVEAGGKQLISDTSFFYRFSNVDKDATVYLSIQRTDKDYAPSPVILTNRNGGFVFSSYIYRTENGTVLMLLDLQKFLEEALFPKPENYNIALLADTENPDTKSVLLLANEILLQAGLPVKYIPKTEFENLTYRDLRQFSAIGLIVTTDEALNPVLIENYLKDGGSIVSLYSGSFPAIAPLLGSIYDTNLELNNEGYRISQEMVMTNGYTFKNEEMAWFAGQLTPESNAVVLGTDYSKNMPLLWSTNVDYGKVFVWNWNGFKVHQLAGLILESFLYVHPVGAAGTLGFAHMFIDDWPLSMTNNVKEPYVDQNITDTEYYTNIWWPDIKNLFTKYNVPYSNYIVFNYNAFVEPQFTAAEFYYGSNNASLALIEDLIELEAEMGLHGYNHISLTLKDTEVNIIKWSSRENMVLALTESKRLISNLIGKQYLPFSYVAPNNIIDQTAISAIHEVYPSIKIISALRWGTGEEFYSPFIPHPAYPDIYYFPRITYGFRSDINVINNLVSGVIGPGVVSHFIHPDDVYDPYRSEGKDWDTLYTEFDNILAFVQTHFPWIEWIDMRDAYHIMIRQDNAQFNFKWEDNTLYVSVEPDIMFRIRPNNGLQLVSAEGAEIIYSYSTMPAIILKANGKNVVLKFN